LKIDLRFLTLGPPPPFFSLITAAQPFSLSRGPALVILHGLCSSPSRDPPPHPICSPPLPPLYGRFSFVISGCRTVARFWDFKTCFLPRARSQRDVPFPVIPGVPRMLNWPCCRDVLLAEHLNSHISRRDFGCFFFPLCPHTQRAFSSFPCDWIPSGALECVSYVVPEFMAKLFTILLAFPPPFIVLSMDFPSKFDYSPTLSSCYLYSPGGGPHFIVSSLCNPCAPTSFISSTFAFLLSTLRRTFSPALAMQVIQDADAQCVGSGASSLVSITLLVVLCQFPFLLFSLGAPAFPAFSPS